MINNTNTLHGFNDKKTVWRPLPHSSHTALVWDRRHNSITQYKSTCETAKVHARWASGVFLPLPYPKIAKVTELAQNHPNHTSVLSRPSRFVAFRSLLNCQMLDYHQSSAEHYALCFCMWREIATSRLFWFKKITYGLRVI